MSHNDGRCARFTRVICNCSFNRLYRTLVFACRSSVRYVFLQTTELVEATASRRWYLYVRGLVSSVARRSVSFQFFVIHMTKIRVVLSLVISKANFLAYTDRIRSESYFSQKFEIRLKNIDLLIGPWLDKEDNVQSEKENLNNSSD